ncbi:MAG: hypothetical protein AAGF23_16830, partial [Acidobacteriota bacterium]
MVDFTSVSRCSELRQPRKMFHQFKWIERYPMDGRRRILVFIIAQLYATCAFSTANNEVRVDKLMSGEKVAVVVDPQPGDLPIHSLTLQHVGPPPSGAGVELEWRLSATATGARPDDHQDSLVRFRLRIRAGSLTVHAVLRSDHFPYAEIPMNFGPEERPVDLAGRFKLTEEEVAGIQKAASVQVDLTVRRTRIKDLAVLPSSIPSVAGGLLRNVSHLEQEGRRLEDLVEELRRQLREKKLGSTSGGGDSPGVIEQTLLMQPIVLPANEEGTVSAPMTAQGFISGYFRADRNARVAARYVIATLPDPVDSRFAREFDLMLGSIRKGIEQLGQSHALVGHYLPWSSAKGAEKAWQQDEPGVVIFHGENDGRTAGGEVDAIESDIVLLLVGELPGSGVRREAMEMALALARPQGAPDRPVSILGPTFSGSRESLVRLLEPTKIKASLVSGSATSASNAQVFGRAGIDFKAIPAKDDGTTCAILGFLKDDLGISPSEVVIFAESSLYGSAFGKSSDSCRRSRRKRSVNV